MLILQGLFGRLAANIVIVKFTIFFLWCIGPTSNLHLNPTSKMYKPSVSKSQIHEIWPKSSSKIRQQFVKKQNKTKTKTDSL